MAGVLGPPVLRASSCSASNLTPTRLSTHFRINLILTLLGWLPGTSHALWLVGQPVKAAAGLFSRPEAFAFIALNLLQEFGWVVPGSDHQARPPAQGTRSHRLDGWPVIRAGCAVLVG